MLVFGVTLKARTPQMGRKEQFLPVLPWMGKESLRTEADV
jgi:hypothetical protein